MNVTLSKSNNIIRTALTDAALLLVICTIPALSHLFAIPFYQLNPMLLCLLAGMLLVRDPRNAYLLAVLLPIASMLATGMPTPLKVLCMVPELLTVVTLYQILNTRMGHFGALLTSIIAGKGVYYLLKALIFSPSLLVGTSLWLQLGVAILFASLFAFIERKRV